MGLVFTMFQSDWRSNNKNTNNENNANSTNMMNSHCYILVSHETWNIYRMCRIDIVYAHERQKNNNNKKKKQQQQQQQQQHQQQQHRQ